MGNGRNISGKHPVRDICMILQEFSFRKSACNKAT